MWIFDIGRARLTSLAFKYIAKFYSNFHIYAIYVERTHWFLIPVKRVCRPILPRPASTRSRLLPKYSFLPSSPSLRTCFRYGIGFCLGIFYLISDMISGPLSSLPLPAAPPRPHPPFPAHTSRPTKSIHAALCMDRRCAPFYPERPSN